MQRTEGRNAAENEGKMKMNREEEEEGMMLGFISVRLSIVILARKRRR